MIAKKIVEKAVEGGWRYSCSPTIFTSLGDGTKCDYTSANEHWSVWIRVDNGSSICVPHEQTVLTREFWQGLAKSLRWDKADSQRPADQVWLAKADQFYRLLLVGGDTAGFWDGLLTDAVTAA